MKPQNQQQRQRQIPPVLHASIFPRPRLRSAQGWSRLSAALRPLARHSVALTNPSALLSLLRYGKNERKKLVGDTGNSNSNPKTLYPLCCRARNCWEKAPSKKQTKERSVQPVSAAPSPPRPSVTASTFRNPQTRRGSPRPRQESSRRRKQEDEKVYENKRFLLTRIIICITITILLF